ncbi:hypothetical protein [Bifidobacterium boum]|uniref:Uncharacterized protein n=1 Tax=Bifidobacterium boum TaxID=78343 RepID=A0A086ZPU9_9BIFI|nr:hypothetical protein [Bifidobacterium boum]KFI48549.1 hypothetical protein BBOU_0678 [Bifidobacterium boum]
MKQSWLWKHVESRVGDRVRRMMRGNETGVAMLMALIFVVILIVTTTLVASVLIAQFAPYRRNTQNAQAAVVAENGLQSGLSYLREAETGASSLLPSTTTDLSKASQDDEYTVDTTSSSGVKVVLNNASDTTSTTSTASTADYTTRNWTYSVTIQFYKDNPATTTSAAPLTEGQVRSGSDINYAAVTSRAYFDRYGSGRTTSVKPIRVMWAVYQFGVSSTTTTTTPSISGGGGGRLGMGFYAAAPFSTFGRETQPIWGNVAISSGTAADAVLSGEVAFSNAVNENTSHELNGSSVMNPANQTCMVATTRGDLNLNDNLSLNDIVNLSDPDPLPKEGSILLILPQAYVSGARDGKDVYTYTEQCQSGGAYKNLNNWVYWKDNSIRPTSRLDLCVTGVDIASSKMPARLEKCGNSYGPNNQSDYYTDPDHKAQIAEKADPKSLLNKYQKWVFYNGFINAGYLNDNVKKKSDYISQFKSKLTADQLSSFDSLPEASGYSLGGIQDSQSGDGDTKVQYLYLSNANNKLYADGGFSGGNISGFNPSFASGSYHYLMSSGWGHNDLTGTGWWDYGGATEDATASFGQAGESGRATNQLVSETSGYCLMATNDGNDAYSDTCYVGTGDWNPYCYVSEFVNKVGDKDTKQATGCATAIQETDANVGTARNRHNNHGLDAFPWKNDAVQYNEDPDGNGVPTTLWTWVGNDGNAVKKYYQFSEWSSSGRFTAPKLVDSEAAATHFTRYSSKASDQYKKGTLQTASGKCLTEIYPGDTINGTAAYPRKDGRTAVALVQCATAGTDYIVKDYRGRAIKSQIWNADVAFSSSGPSGGSGGTTTVVPGPTTAGSNGFIFTRELTRDGSI